MPDAKTEDVGGAPLPGCLFEGGMVLIMEDTSRNELRGGIGKLLRFPFAVVELGARGFLVSIMDPEPVEKPEEE